MFFRNPMFYYNKVRLYTEDLPFKIDIKDDEINNLINKNLKKTDSIFIYMASKTDIILDKSVSTYTYGLNDAPVYNPFLQIKNTEELMDLCNYMFDVFVIQKDGYDESFLESMKRFLFMVIWQMWETDINNCSLNNIYNIINSYRFAPIGKSELDKLFNESKNVPLKKAFASFMSDKNISELIAQLLLSIEGFEKNGTKEENKKNKKSFEELLKNRIIYLNHNDLITNNIFLYQLALYKMGNLDTPNIIIISDNEKLTKFETFAYLDIQQK